MLNLTAQKVIADNTVAINGVVVGKLTDSDAERLIGIINGMMNTASGSKPVSTELHIEEEPAKKSTYKGLKNLEYHITKQGDLYCISRGIEAVSKTGNRYLKNGGFTKAEKSCINAGIKALEGIVTTRVKGNVEYTAWGYGDEETAIKMMRTLPTEYSAEEVAKYEKKRA